MSSGKSKELSLLNSCYEYEESHSMATTAMHLRLVFSICNRHFLRSECLGTSECLVLTASFMQVLRCRAFALKLLPLTFSLMLELGANHDLLSPNT